MDKKPLKTQLNDASSDILMGSREAFLFLFSLKQMQSMQSILQYNKLNIFCQVKTGYRIFSDINGISDCDCALRFIGHFLQLTNLNSRLSSILRGWASLSSSSSTRTTNAWQSLTKDWRLCDKKQGRGYEGRTTRYKYTNTNTQIQKYKNTKTNTQIQLHKYKNTKTICRHLTFIIKLPMWHHLNVNPIALEDQSVKTWLPIQYHLKTNPSPLDFYH